MTIGAAAPACARRPARSAGIGAAGRFQSPKRALRERARILHVDVADEDQARVVGTIELRVLRDDVGALQSRERRLRAVRGMADTRRRRTRRGPPPCVASLPGSRNATDNPSSASRRARSSSAWREARRARDLGDERERCRDVAGASRSSSRSSDTSPRRCRACRRAPPPRPRSAARCASPFPW